MPVTVGKTYYFIIHGYHHVIATVNVITGKREADVVNVIRVQSCGRPWTAFFRDGFQTDTEIEYFPDGSITWIAAFEWKHALPEHSITAGFDGADKKQPDDNDT